jgi:hypothetical protein
LEKPQQVRFAFFPLRFEFTARDPLFFPPGQAANTLRGALGVIFKRIACLPQCQVASQCNIRQSCPYAKVFEPTAHGEGPSGLADSPRPFVFRARHLDAQTIQPGQPFHFDLNVFSPDRAVLDGFVNTFAALAHEGLGPGRGKADLQSVRRVAVGSLPEKTLCPGTEPVALDLAPLDSAPRSIRVEFLTPTELKHDHCVSARPEFPILFARIRDRVATLRRLYGEGPLEIDFQGSGLRAATVRMTRCEGRRVEATRHSTRTGRSHSLGGFVGTAEYEGDLAEFLPYLEAARWTGVGRQSVWGKGEIAIGALPPPD